MVSRFMRRGGLFVVAAVTACVVLVPCQRALAAVQPTFSRTDIVVGGNPGSPTIADINGDGNQDIAVLTSSVLVMYGNGRGGFSAPVAYAAGNRPNSVAVGDLNGDGRPDMAVADEAAAEVSVLLANGSGGFAAPVSYPCSATPVRVRIADMNRDGKPDLVVSNFGADNVGILLGAGDGTFGPQTTFPVAAGPHAEVADVDRNGTLDVVAPDYYSDSIAVSLGNGDGTLSRPETYAVGFEPMAVGFGDFNKDGATDIVSADMMSANVSVLMGKGDGTFEPRRVLDTSSYPDCVAVADFNRDGNDDIAAGCGHGNSVVSLQLGDGSGGFERSADVSVGLSPWGIAAGDLNKDGAPDLVVANNDAGTVSVLLNTTVPPPPLTGTVRINGGAAYTNAASVTLGLSADGASEMMIANDAAFSGAVWQPYAPTSTWTLTSGDGAKTVYARFRGAPGTESTSASAGIVLDSTPPVTSSDAAGSYLGHATISLTAVDTASGVDTTRYAVDGGPAVTGASVTVGDVGAHTLAFSSVDKAGNREATKTVDFMVRAFSRLAGSDRYATSIEVSKRAFPSGAPAVVIAYGGNYPDALAAAPLAKAYGGPVLLTPTDAMPAALVAELERLAPGRVFIAGSASVVSPQVESDLGKLSSKPQVTRLGGADRFATCALIADQLKEKLGTISKVAVVTGFGYADALSISPLAADKGWPILLVRPDSVPADIASARERLAPASALVVGSRSVVSDTVMGAFPSAERASGPTRYDTCAAVFDYGKSQGVTVAHVGIAVGTNFPDALSAGPYLAQDSGLLLLTDTDNLPSVIGQRLKDEKATIGRVDAVGSTLVVSDAVVSQVQAALQ